MFVYREERLTIELRVREVAKLFAVPEKRIYEWIKGKGLPARQISGQHRFNRAELLEWATARQVHLSSDIFGEQENGSARTPSFADALQAGGIFHGVGVSDRESALRAIVKNRPCDPKNSSLPNIPGSHRGEEHPLPWKRRLAHNPGDSLKSFWILVTSGAAVWCGLGFIQLRIQDSIAQEKRRNPNT